MKMQLPCQVSYQRVRISQPVALTNSIIGQLCITKKLYNGASVNPYTNK